MLYLTYVQGAEPTAVMHEEVDPLSPDEKISQPMDGHGRSMVPS